MTTGPFGDIDAEARKLAGLEGFIEDQNKGLRIRQGQIVSYNAGTFEATIYLGGDTTEIPGVRHLASYRPTVNDLGVLVLFIGATPLLLGAIYADDPNVFESDP